MVLVDTALIATANIGGAGGITPAVSSEIVEQHEKILEVVQNTDECISVFELVDLTGYEEETVKEHLKIMELNKFGTFSSEDGEFCSYTTLEKMKERMSKIKEMEMM